MTRFLRVVVFILSFQIDIHVHASDVSSEAFKALEVVEFPAHCLMQRITCSVQYQGRSGQLEIQNATLKLSENTSFVRSGAGRSVRLLKGSLGLTVKNESFTVNTDHVEISLPTDAKVFLYRDLTRTSLQVFKGEVQVKSVDGKQSWVLKEGFQNWFGRINDNGRTEIGVVKPVESVDPEVPIKVRSIAEASDAYRGLIEKELEEQKKVETMPVSNLKKQEREKFLRRVLLDGHIDQ